MIKTKYLELLNIAAASTLSDTNTLNIYKSIDVVLREIDIKYREKLILLETIDKMTNEELDLMFWSYSDHIGNIGINLKRKLLKKALLSRVSRGTTGILKKMCKELYEGFEVKEWFEYNGTPGKFKIKTSDESIVKSKYLGLINTVNLYKNARSHLETVELGVFRNLQTNFSAFKEMRLIQLKENRKTNINIISKQIIIGYKEIMGVQTRNEI